MGFPNTRMRRLRTTPTMRRLVRETTVTVDDLVYPMFVCPGENVRTAIASLRGCFHMSPDRIAAEAAEVASLGIPAVLLFGLPRSSELISDSHRLLDECHGIVASMFEPAWVPLFRLRKCLIDSALNRLRHAVKQRLLSDLG